MVIVVFYSGIGVGVYDLGSRNVNSQAVIAVQVELVVIFIVVKVVVTVCLFAVPKIKGTCAVVIDPGIPIPVHGYGYIQGAG